MPYNESVAEKLKSYYFGEVLLLALAVSRQQLQDGSQRGAMESVSLFSEVMLSFMFLGELLPSFKPAPGMRPWSSERCPSCADLQPGHDTMGLKCVLFFP